VISHIGARPDQNLAKLVEAGLVDTGPATASTN
jgi:hypothetical protein